LLKVADSDYFKRLFDAIRDHSPGLRKWLLEYQLSPLFNPTGQAPSSLAKDQMISLNTSDEFGAVKDLIEEGGYGFNGKILSSKHLSTALSLMEDVEVPKSTALHKMLLKLGFSKMEKKIKWKGVACHVWVKGSYLELFNGLDEASTNDKIRSLLDENPEKDLLT